MDFCISCPDFLLTDGNEKDGKRIIVTAFLGCHGSFERYVNGIDEFPAVECSIGTILVGSKLQWEALDSVVRRALKVIEGAGAPFSDTLVSPRGQQLKEYKHDLFL